LAGYTNAGKSSLLNTLTGADVLAYDKLFATLDSTTRKLVLPEGREMTLTDTVGFIQKLPTTLIEAFKSTLDEIVNADLILHVVDASARQRDAQAQAVREVLEQIGAHTIPQLLVFNKCDLLDEEGREVLGSRFPQGILVSALTGEGITGANSDDGAIVSKDSTSKRPTTLSPADQGSTSPGPAGQGPVGLLVRMEQVMNATSALLSVVIPFTEGSLVQLAHQRCTIVSERFTEEGTVLQLQVPPALSSRFEPYAAPPVQPRSA
jgi:GTP-binding protein HflX